MQRRFLFLSDHFVGVDVVFTYKLSNVQLKVSPHRICLTS